MYVLYCSKNFLYSFRKAYKHFIQIKLRIEKNLTIIFITHDLASARYLADRILVLSKGTLVEQNKAEDLIKNPERSYTKKLVRAASPGWLNEITK